MIAYHGSNHNFKTFKISESLVNRESTRVNEGIGIYFTTDINIAKSYGKYLYTIEINENYFIDFRKKRNCQLYLSKLRNYVKEKTKIDICKYIDLNSVVDYAYFGGIAIWGIPREIELLLDSNEAWYRLSESTINKVYGLLKCYSKKNLKAYMFNYSIKDTGVIKDASSDVVKIVKKENSY